MIPTWIQFFLDVPEPHWSDAAQFWSAATGCAVSAARGESGQFVTLLPSTGDAWLKMQAVPNDEPRVHLDLDTSDRVRARADALELGATDAWTYEEVTVMRSPGRVDLLQHASRYGRASAYGSASDTGRARPGVYRCSDSLVGSGSSILATDHRATS